MSDKPQDGMVTVSQATLDKLQEDVGETLAGVREVTASANELKKFESDFRRAEAAGAFNKVHRDEKATPHRAAWGAPTRENSLGEREYGGSIHDLLKVISNERGEGWSKAGLSERWQDEFRANPGDFRTREMGAGRERAANMSAGVNTQGGFWVGEDWMSDIIPALTAQQVVMAAGAREFNVAPGTGQVHFPREDSRPTGYWVGEGSAPTTSGITAGDVVAAPKFGAILIKVTEQLLRMSAPAVEAYLRFAISRELGLLADIAFFNGTGSNSEPLGLDVMTDVGNVSIGANGGAITYAALRNLEDTLLAANPRGDRISWVMHANLMAEIKKLTDDNARPLLTSPDYAPGLAGPAPRTLFGYPVHLCNQLSVTLTKASGTGLTECFLGDFSYAQRVMWEQMEIRQSREAGDGTDNAFPQNLRFFLGLFTMDWLVEQPAAFAYIDDASA